MKRGALFLIVALLFCSGCVQKIPREALALSPQTLADRQIETRRFDTGNETAILAASNAVLQDLGFNLDESEVDLGVLVGSKERTAVDGGQVAAALFLAALTGASTPVDDHQIIRVSLVARSIDDGSKKETALTPEKIAEIRGKVEKALSEGLAKQFPDEVCRKVAAKLAENTADTLANDLDTLMEVKECPGTMAVRVTFQRVVFNTAGQVTLAAQVKDPKIYQEFFDKLSQAVFLEAQEI